MKTVKQIDLLLKNEPGSLSAVSDLLGLNGINIIAFYVVTEGDQGKPFDLIDPAAPLFFQGF